MKLSNSDRVKNDMSDDELFYKNPRYVHHLSLSFRNRLTKLYSEYLCSHFIILDLMSSWISHLPDKTKYKKIIGHGMNELELKANKRLDSYWLQNLNKSQNLPLEDSTVNVALIVAGWQYLQYPENISRELSRVIKSDSLLIISFTNRAFWTKSPNIWTYSSDIKRIYYLTSVLSTHGWKVEKILNEKTYENKLFGLYKSESDPFLSVIARNNKSNN